MTSGAVSRANPTAHRKEYAHPRCASAGSPVSPLFVGFLGVLLSGVLIIVGIMRSPR